MPNIVNTWAHVTGGMIFVRDCMRGCRVRGTKIPKAILCGRIPWASQVGACVQHIRSTRMQGAAARACRKRASGSSDTPLR